MLVFLLLSLELHISPNPIEGKVGERIPFTVRVLDREGKILNSDLSFSVVPNSLGRIQGNFFIASQEGRGVLKCRSMINGKHVTGFAYIKILDRESAKILPPVAILKKGEQIKFTIDGGTAKEWKCIPATIGNIRNGVFTAENSGRGRVIALLADGEIKTAFIRVSGKVSDIQIIPRFKRIKAGEKIQFEVKGNEIVTWRVEGENIGEINTSGLFTAKIPGKAVIIAEKNGNEGRAIVVVSGEVGLRIIPESVTLKTGERVHFKVNAEGFGNVNIPVSWKVIPEHCGQIRKDGTFIAGEIPVKGRVIAVLPQRFGKGVVSADVYITSDKIRPLEMVPSFKLFALEDINKEFRFGVVGAQKISLQWRVIPEDLGSINNNGVFIPKRFGAGVLMAEPRAEINIKPARAFVIIGEDRFSRGDTNIYSWDGSPDSNQPRGFIEFVFPSQQVIEGFKIPLTLNKAPAAYAVTWKVIPYDAGRIILNREFQANKLPEGIDQRNVKVFAFLHRGREIVAWTSRNITVIKAQ
jgi:hypothetical protein